MTDPLISIDHLSKQFCRDIKRSLKYAIYAITREFLPISAQPALKPGEFLALDQVDLKINRGDCIGLLGPNGAGKTTLLKLINHLIKPDRGSVTTRGRIGALIQLSAGFQNVLSGRENIFIKGALFGLSRKEICTQLNAIIAFSELGEAIDAPIQSYSAGMRIRLGFAIAVHMNPDILLIDEILAVGDAGFRNKCYEKIESLKNRCAIIIISHNMHHIERLCNRVIILQKGKITYNDRDVSEGINTYLRLFRHQPQTKCELFSITELTINDLTGNPLPIGNTRPIKLDYILQNSYPECYKIKILFTNLNMEPIAQATSPSKEPQVVSSLQQIELPALSTGLDRLYLNFHFLNKENEIVGKIERIRTLIIEHTDKPCFIPTVLNGHWN